LAFFKRKKGEAHFILKIIISFLFIATADVDFTNILRAAFMPADPKSTKDTNNVTVYLRLWDLCA